MVSTTEVLKCISGLCTLTMLYETYKPNSRKVGTFFKFEQNAKIKDFQIT